MPKPDKNSEQTTKLRATVKRQCTTSQAQDDVTEPKDQLTSLATSKKAPLLLATLLPLTACISIPILLRISLWKNTSLVIHIPVVAFDFLRPIVRRRHIRNNANRAVALGVDFFSTVG